MRRDARQPPVQHLHLDSRRRHLWLGQSVADRGSGGITGASSASVSETRTYNNMLQLTHLVSSALGYQPPNTYTGGGVDIQYVYNTGHNNGRVSQTIDNTLGETVNYSYDYLHRLTGATATNGTWGEAYAYDGFGNLTWKTPTQGYAPAMTGSADSNATGGASVANGTSRSAP